MPSYLIQRLPVYHYENQLYITSISLDNDNKTFIPMFVSPSNANNDAFVKVENDSKFSLGIKKKYSTFDFKIIFDETSNKYQLFYNQMNVYILKENNQENMIYSQDDEFHFISTENNIFFQHPITSYLNKEVVTIQEESVVQEVTVQEEVVAIQEEIIVQEEKNKVEKKRKGRKSKETSPIVSTSDSSPVVQETVVQETVVEEAVVQEAVVQETIVEEAVVQETIVEEAVVHETVVKEAVVQEAVVQETVVQETVVQEAVVQEAVKEEVIEAVVKEVVQEEIIEEEVIEESVIHEEVIEESVIEESVIQEAVIHEEVIEESVIEESVVQEAVVHEEVIEDEVTHEEVVKEEEINKKNENKVIQLPFIHQNKVYKTNVYLLSGIVENNLQKILNENVPSENFIFKENNKNTFGLLIENKKAYLVNIQHEKYLLLRVNESTLFIQNLTTKKFENIIINNNILLGKQLYTLTNIFNTKSNAPLLLIPVNGNKIYDNHYGLNRTVYSPIIS